MSMCNNYVAHETRWCVRDIGVSHTQHNVAYATSEYCIRNSVLRMQQIFTKKTRPDTRAKTVRRALLILRTILSSIRPIPSAIPLTVDEYDNDQKHEFLHLSLAL